MSIFSAMHFAQYFSFSFFFSRNIIAKNPTGKKSRLFLLDFLKFYETFSSTRPSK
ncbi:hypothetical protein CpecG_0138 [Chlamydia pecorum MC/MarsBar]|uniref:Uncharacterized protein n=1 Tax=Chlamydia pecorum (strain ATCC VR-628 / DSM 29919 / E58) TaxID=331635 RepID=A0AA34WHL0_CHLPE|nr:hypothetical protein G5S_0157 [Chlamydia pecorum E58]ETF38533.1 hypothetical protein CpecS_0141 [Chlamydia pecorum VR629]ETF39038.1 hypothetical protein CpecF_0138 [Chlamydia pecorum DBDeUG]ETF39714.1 hypothetical protein CpecG_0138 [Chlamydia pecorum MC/MarsBar]ETF40764.1 hypothetical protein CpecA_0139 [Chlamydia pecorum IPTaLE]